MATEHQDARTYPINARALYHLALSAVRTIGTHIENQDSNVGIIYARHTIYQNGILPFGSLIWQELIVEVQPIDSQESVIGVTSKFPGLLELTDIFNRNEKQVDEFFILLIFRSKN